MKPAKDLIKKLIRKTPARLRTVLLEQLSGQANPQDPGFDVFSILARLKEQGWVPAQVIDIGAHEGVWSQRVATQIFGDAEFFLIEPLVEKKEFIEKAMLGFNYQYFPWILSDKANCRITFFEMETGSSIYQEASSFPRLAKTFDTHTLSELAGDIKGTALLKIDVQGAELDVLKGAGPVLNMVEVIVLELSVLNYNKDAPLAHELISYLATHGFLLYDIAGFNRKQQGHVLVQFDGIFIRKESKVRIKMNDFSVPYNLYTQH